MHDATQSPVLGIILGIITIVVTKLSPFLGEAAC